MLSSDYKFVAGQEQIIHSLDSATVEEQSDLTVLEPCIAYKLCGQMCWCGFYQCLRKATNSSMRAVSSCTFFICGRFERR